MDNEFGQMQIEYDGPSLPMLCDKKFNTYRIQKLVGGQWKTLEFETQYVDFARKLRDHESR